MNHFSSKVLLFGEYSALYNSMALVMPLDKFSGELTFDTAGETKNSAYRSNEYLKKFSAFIASHMDENFVLEVKLFEKEIENGLFFKSNIPQGYGLGSSGALVAAIFLRYLKKAKELKDELKIITAETAQKLKFTLAEMESFFHGNSSGLDPLSIILNQPILFRSATDVAPVIIPPQNKEGKNTIFLLNTKVGRHTESMMAHFKNLYTDVGFQEKINRDLVNFANQSITSFLDQNSTAFYQDLSHLVKFQLDEMSYFIPEQFHSKIANGLDNGDYFLKICGAGGGGYMLGFTENWSATQDQLNEYDLEMIYQY